MASLPILKSERPPSWSTRRFSNVSSMSWVSPGRSWLYQTMFPLVGSSASTLFVYSASPECPRWNRAHGFAWAVAQ